MFSPNYYSGVANNYALLPLAVAEPTTNRVDMFSLVPQLVKSFTLKGHTLHINLQPNAKWSNGDPVTSTDLVDDEYLMALSGYTPFFLSVKSMTTDGPHAATIVSYPNVANVNERGDLAAIKPVPSSVYGKFLTPALEKDLFTYGTLYRKDPTAAANSPAYKAMQTALTALQKFEPSSFVSDGPFNVDHVTQAQANLVKSKTYFGASSINPGNLNILNEGASTTSTGSTNVYPLLFSHRIDWYTGTGVPATIIDRWKSTSDAGLASAANDTEEDIYFNNAKAPFNDARVRQAIAYVVDRQKVLEEEGGGTTYSHYTKIPYGMTDTVGPVWATQSELASLNPYNVDTAKATTLLTQAGLKKQGSTWDLPSGQPFTASIIVPSGSSSQLVAMQTAASELSAFGIKTTASAVEATTDTTDLENGKFDMAWATGGNGNLEPMCGYASPLGPPNNFSTTTQKGVGFGPAADLPGVGNVNIPQVVDSQCQHTQAGPLMANLAWSWAQLVNQQMPFLPYGDDYVVSFYSKQNFGNWPAANSPLWAYTGLNNAAALMIMMENGYIKQAA